MKNELREAYEYQLQFVKQYLVGKGWDIGCGNCPLLVDDTVHFDMSPQPLTVQQVGKERFVQRNCQNMFLYETNDLVDFIFSSHMVEDLPTKQAIIDCLVSWCMHLRENGFLVLMLPDMQGGRYSTVEEGGNPSHRVNVGKEFILSIQHELYNRAGILLIQLDTVPHDKSCSIDVVFKKVGV